MIPGFGRSEVVMKFTQMHLPPIDDLKNAPRTQLLGSQKRWNGVPCSLGFKHPMEICSGTSARILRPYFWDFLSSKQSPSGHHPRLPFLKGPFCRKRGFVPSQILSNICKIECNTWWFQVDFPSTNSFWDMEVYPSGYMVPKGHHVHLKPSMVTIGDDPLNHSLIQGGAPVR